METDKKRTTKNLHRTERRRERARQARIERANMLFTPEMRLELAQQQTQADVDFARLQEALRDPEGFAERQKLDEFGPFHHAFGSDCSLS